jgi:lipopolysaccharide/colanic/teichoic acid biosynthesis glycosyltransferase
VIGSNSKDKAGDLYTVDIQLKLMSKVSRRNKRILDLFSSLCFLILFPVLVFIVKKPLGFLANIVNVLIGKKSWVGLKFNDKSLTKHVKAGVLNPSSYLSSSIIDESTAKRLDMIYAKDYETTSDINIISRSLMYLGQ